MKRIFLVLLAVLVVFCCGCGSDPDLQIRGVVIDVKVYPNQSFLTSPIITIEFKDGRIIHFRGIAYGTSFQKGECYVITYSNWDERISRVEKCDTK